MSNSTQRSANPIDLADIKKLKPLDLLKFARRFTTGSWLLVVGLAVAVCGGAFGIGWSYRSGSLPEALYFLHEGSESPVQERKNHEQRAAFEEAYSEFVDWQTLSALAAGIAEESPDGLESDFEIVFSLLAQVRATRAGASFLSGERQISVGVERVADGFEFEWNETPSNIRRIARDAGYELTDIDLREINANLNRGQFSYLDDAMEHAVIYRALDGYFGLVIREP